MCHIFKTLADCGCDCLTDCERWEENYNREHGTDDRCSTLVCMILVLAFLLSLVAFMIGLYFSIVLLILIVGAWLPYACYGRPNTWKDYICQWCLLTWCWCSANRPPQWITRNCSCCVCYQIVDSGSPTGN